MDIHELCALIDDDSEARITGLRSNENDLCIELTTDAYHDTDLQRRFEIRATDVQEYNITPRYCGSVTFTSDHVLLWDYIKPSQQLYFQSAPQNVHEVIGILYETTKSMCGHWRPLSRYANGYGITKVLERGHGLLATAPEPIISAYRKALTPLLKLNTLATQKRQEAASALVLDEMFAVCTQAIVSELTDA